jgi:hypothetical protein
MNPSIRAYLAQLHAKAERAAIISTVFKVPDNPAERRRRYRALVPQPGSPRSPELEGMSGQDLLEMYRRMLNKELEMYRRMLNKE